MDQSQQAVAYSSSLRTPHWATGSFPLLMKIRLEAIHFCFGGSKRQSDIHSFRHYNQHSTSGLCSWILSTSIYFLAVKDEVFIFFFKQVSCREAKSLGNFVKAMFTAFYSWDRGSKGRKIHGMGRFCSLSNLNLLVLVLVQGLASSVD